MTDLSKYRNDFPVLQTQMNGQSLAFLDSAASAQKPQVVIDAMRAVMESGYSNIHRGLYDISQKLTEEYEDVRARIGRFINAPSDKNIVFTRNATEAVNLVAHSWGGVHLQAGDEIILTEMEHHANIVPWQLLRDKTGVVIKVMPVDDRGVLDLDAYESLLSGKTRLVACTHISNALGTINPVRKIIELSRKFNPEIKVLIDGSQGVVHGVVDVRAMDCDFYVFTGHKLYAPTGVGVLYGKMDALRSMTPYQGGGDMIDRVTFAKTTYKEPPFRFEAGTPAIIEVIGLGAAVDYIVDIGMDNIAAHENKILKYAMESLEKIDEINFYGSAPDKAGIISFTMDCAHISDIAMVLDQCGVAVRTGHHCCMPLMDRYGIDGTVRASFGLYTNEEDIDQLVAGLRKVSGLFGG